MLNQVKSYHFILLWAQFIFVLSSLLFANSPGNEGVQNGEVALSYAEINEFDEDLFDIRIAEAKELFTEAVIFDKSGDALQAEYSFEVLFETLSNLMYISREDEYQTLEYNRFLQAAINYYENDSNSLENNDSGMAVAVLRDQLNQYTYNQTLEDLEFVEETVQLDAGHIPITYNTRVQSIINFFQKQGRRSVEIWLSRMDRFKRIMLPIIEEEGVPPEIFYLAMIESGLNPYAYSHAYASGPWQFIRSTAKHYNLKIDWWVDERRDFEKSTRAACRYLKDLYKETNDWYLTFASYNYGLSRVKKAAARQGSNDYWDLRRLPAETRNYVPNIMAIFYIANDPKKYGFRLDPLPEYKWHKKTLDKSVSLEMLAKISAVNIKTLRDFNPELKRDVIPPLEDGQVYHFRLPVTANAKFDSLFALLEDENKKSMALIPHKVKRGENMWLISRKYKSPINDIVTINKLLDAKKIYPGQILQIPSPGFLEAQEASRKAAQPKKIYYTVKRGDSLIKIAKRYRTSVRKIKHWNGLRGDMIRIRQKLIIWK